MGHLQARPLQRLGPVDEIDARYGQAGKADSIRARIRDYAGEVRGEASLDFRDYHGA